MQILQITSSTCTPLVQRTFVLLFSCPPLSRLSSLMKPPVYVYLEYSLDHSASHKALFIAFSWVVFSYIFISKFFSISIWLGFRLIALEGDPVHFSCILLFQMILSIILGRILPLLYSHVVTYGSLINYGYLIGTCDYLVLTCCTLAIRSTHPPWLYFYSTFT
jgi:hypothetical protein